MMKGKTIGMQRGTVWIEEVTKENPNRLFVDDQDSIFKILEAKPVRYVFGNKRHLNFIKKKGYSAHMLSPPVAEIGIYPHIHVKNADLISQLYKTLTKMDEKGDVKRIRNEFLKKYTKLQ